MLVRRSQPPVPVLRWSRWHNDARMLDQADLEAGVACCAVLNVHRFW